MNIEDRDARHGRAVDGRLPLTAEGGEGRGGGVSDGGNW